MVRGFLAATPATTELLTKIGIELVIHQLVFSPVSHPPVSNFVTNWS